MESGEKFGLNKNAQYTLFSSPPNNISYFRPHLIYIKCLHMLERYMYLHVYIISLYFLS